MSEWLKETGCKPVGLAYAGSNPAPPTVSDRRLGAAGLGELLLEPVVGERLVVEWRHLDPARGAVEGHGLGEGGARLDVRDACPAHSSASLEVLEQAPPEAEPACRRREPHALDLGGLTGVVLHGTAPDRLAVQVD